MASNGISAAIGIAVLARFNQSLGLAESCGADEDDVLLFRRRVEEVASHDERIPSSSPPIGSKIVSSETCHKSIDSFLETFFVVTSKDPAKITPHRYEYIFLESNKRCPAVHSQFESCTAIRRNVAEFKPSRNRGRVRTNS